MYSGKELQSCRCPTQMPLPLLPPLWFHWCPLSASSVLSACIHTLLSEAVKYPSGPPLCTIVGDRLPKFHMKAFDARVLTMIKLFIDADSLPQRHRAIILRRIIGKDYEAWFAADRALPDVMKAIEEDKRIRRAAVRETTTREEARRIGSNIHMETVGSGTYSFLCQRPGKQW